MINWNVLGMLERLCTLWISVQNSQIFSQIQIVGVHSNLSRRDRGENSINERLNRKTLKSKCNACFLVSPDFRCRSSIVGHDIRIENLTVTHAICFRRPGALSIEHPTDKLFSSPHVGPLADPSQPSFLQNRTHRSHRLKFDQGYLWDTIA